jgi:hypothetical protein
MGNYPDATAVFDVDAIGLVNIVHNLNRGLDLGGNPIGAGTSFVIGVGANPGLPNLDEEIKRFEYKVQAGAEYVVTQPVFDLTLLDNFLKRIEHSRIPVVAGIWPLVSARNAEFMKNELRVSVPDEILEPHDQSRQPASRSRGRRGHRSRNAGRGPRTSAGGADQRAAGPLYLRGRCSRGSRIKTSRVSLNLKRVKFSFETPPSKRLLKLQKFTGHFPSASCITIESRSNWIGKV